MDNATYYIHVKLNLRSDFMDLINMRSESLLARGTWSGTWVCWATNQIDLDGINVFELTTPGSTELKVRDPRQKPLNPID